ncbi:hypothetical protein MRX96_036947 [Rhipicephalus microplus]
MSNVDVARQRPNHRSPLHASPAPGWRRKNAYVRRRRQHGGTGQELRRGTRGEAALPPLPLTDEDKRLPHTRDRRRVNFEHDTKSRPARPVVQKRNETGQPRWRHTRNCRAATPPERTGFQSRRRGHRV